MNIEKLRGVNLGGWLVIEKWMTPTLFAGTDAVDEYTFMQTLGADKKIEHHRKTFITEADFTWLAKHDINAIRIPVGYWLFTGDTPFTATLPYLDWAMKMAKKYKLQAIIDLHALPGSQNGFDHSGKVGKADWFRHRDYRLKSLDALEQIATRYKDNPNFWGLQLINEPRVSVFHFKLRAYYLRAYKRISQILLPHTRIIYSDAFSPRLFAGWLPKRPNQAVMDVHKYHMTTFMSQRFSMDWYYNRLTAYKRLLQRLSKQQPIIIGEWSGALRQTAYDRIPTADHPQLTIDYIARQLDTFEDVAGWFYWNYKTEQPGVWDFKSQVETGVITISAHTDNT